jgi:hypothetical protein
MSLDAFIMPSGGHLLCQYMLLTCHGGHFHIHGHVYYVVGDIYRVHIYFNHALVDIYIYIYILKRDNIVTMLLLDYVTLKRWV